MTIIKSTQNPPLTFITKTIGVLPVVFDDVFDRNKFHYFFACSFM